MSNVTKLNHAQSVGSLMEDFWNNDQFFNKHFFKGEVIPAVNIRNKKGHYEVEVAAPGYKKGDFQITTENGMLTITAETSSEASEKKEHYTRKEFSRSSFSRSFSLPANVEDDHASAKYENGLLTIDLKKTGKDGGEKKEVKVD